MVDFRRRRTDHHLLTHTWKRVSQAQEYNPQWDHASPDNRSAVSPSTANLIDVIEAGMWLQRVVSDKGADAATLNRLVDFLSKAANLEDKNLIEKDKNPYEWSSNRRIAAAYLLWPYHAARYYNYLTVDKEARLESRAALCDIQELLYYNMRGLLDLMRLWFGSTSDENSRKYFEDSEKSPKGERQSWRPRTLTTHIPDLCAIDLLAIHMIDISRARPLVRRAIENIQKLSLNSNIELAEDVGQVVREAFRALCVTQMTVFYYPNPSEVADQEDIPLYELVYRTGDKDPIPAKLIPFDMDEILAKNFRKLATFIYSTRDEQLYPKFIKQRDATINELGNATSFISDGATTNFFLSNEPPAQNGDENGDRIWPIWYSKTLNDAEIDGDPQDWSNWDYWWQQIDSEKLRELLFPGPAGETQLHENDHMSAYWDNVVANKEEFFESINIPPQCPTGAEFRFGYLMELLLRREPQTRTSFFFALAQTYGRETPRLCHFVGGTFLGLEFPGVPFSEERFKAVAAHVRGLVMAVAHYTTTHAVKIERLFKDEQRRNFRERVESVVRLLRGTDKEAALDRKGHLLFATPVTGGRDHDYYPLTGVGWYPSRAQIKSVFNTARHLQQLPQTAQPAASCGHTWKALLYLGGDADKHDTLQKFLDDWRENPETNRDVNSPSRMADRDVACSGCFQDVLKFLLNEIYAPLADKIEIKVPITFPSRPGIRFLIALCRFIVSVQSRTAAEYASITRLVFHPRSVRIYFDKPTLLKNVWEKRGRVHTSFEHTAGIVNALEKSLPIQKTDSNEEWQEFLTSPDFAYPFKMHRHNKDSILHLWW
ncbi:MAG: hypothetical protein QOJ02_1841 [Acidobacteriota bacterium]|nr:hypothetical protein [Acidobacteriota bacterium]